MSQTLTIKLNQTEMKRLSRLALRYGLSLPEFTRKVLVELEEAFPHESSRITRTQGRLRIPLNAPLVTGVLAVCRHGYEDRLRQRIRERI